MGEDRRKHSAPRAGPVAGLPIDELLERAEDMARRWAIALVIARPLDGLGDVPLEDLAREAPQLCELLARALASDEELERLTGAAAGREDTAPARRLAAMSGASSAAATVEAAEALRGAVWETLLEELSWPVFERWHARLVADVSDRLAYVCAKLLAAAIAGGADEADALASHPAAAPAGEGPLAVSSEQQPAGSRRAVIVDEQDDAAVPSRHRRSEIEIRDEREAGPAAWIGSISRQLERFTWDGLPFAVLLVEIRGLDRLRRDDRSDEVSRLADEIEHELASELRTSGGEREAVGGASSGSLTRERAGRYWLLAPGTDRSSAKLLAQRLTDAIDRLARQRRALLEVAVGTAVCPEDGREAAALAAHADVELYAARSSARMPAGWPPATVD